MDRILKIGLCLLLVVVLSCPTIVLAKSGVRSKISNLTTTVYKKGATALDKTGGVLDTCLKSTFGLFNPCLDVIKMCSDVAFKPLDYPFDYIEKRIYKPRVVKKCIQIPAPEKPEMPNK
ncbi:MAG: hypothetical protein M1511_14525 [Deltaproteobacteria bacterium]|nr:hypothetical protein [Deltaproteobacteria bacterium]